VIEYLLPGVRSAMRSAPPRMRTAGSCCSSGPMPSHTADDDRDFRKRCCRVFVEFTQQHLDKFQAA
jgi:hypothetical protein